MIVATASNAYVLFFKAPPSREDFLRHVRARRGTYAAQLMCDLYDDIFLHSLELRREYQRYYSLEYPSFYAFTANFRYLPEEMLPKAEAYYARYQVIIPYSCGSWIFQDEEGLRLLAKVFRLPPKTL